MSQYTNYDFALAEAMTACPGDCCNLPETGQVSEQCLDCKHLQITCQGYWEQDEYECPNREICRK